jgi:hypothetical protein
MPLLNLQGYLVPLCSRVLAQHRQMILDPEGRFRAWVQACEFAWQLRVQGPRYPKESIPAAVLRLCELLHLV